MCLTKLTARLLCVIFLRGPALAVENDAKARLTSSCGHSLIQQSVLPAHSVEIAEAGKHVGGLPPAMETVAKSVAVAVSPVARNIAITATVSKEHVKTNSSVQPGASRDDTTAKSEARAFAKRLVSLAMSTWKFIVVILTVVVVCMICGFLGFEWGKDKRNFGFEHHITWREFKQTQYASDSIVRRQHDGRRHGHTDPNEDLFFHEHIKQEDPVYAKLRAQLEGQREERYARLATMDKYGPGYRGDTQPVENWDANNPVVRTSRRDSRAGAVNCC